MAPNIANMISVAEGMLEVVASAARRQSVLPSSDVMSEFWNLEATVSEIKDLLFQAERRQDDLDEEAKRALERIEDAIYEADGLVNDCIDEVLGGLTSPNKSVVATKVRRFFSTSSNANVFWPEIRDAMKKSREVLLESAYRSGVDRCWFQFEHGNRNIRETYPTVKEEGVIGRDFDKREIMKLVLEDSDVETAQAQNLRVVPVVGVGGIGKTALALLVYNEKGVNEHFDLRMWVCVVSDLLHTRSIVKQLIESAKGVKVTDDFLQMDQLQRELRESIKGKKFFLVLDDVRHISRHSWLSLITLLMGGAEGSTVLVTTRSEKIANFTRTVAEPYHLGPLNVADSFLLLEGEVFLANDREQKVQAFEEIGRQIAGKCEGVPLFIKEIGSSLRSKHVDKWQSFDPEEKISEVKRDYGLEAKEDQETEFSSGMEEQTHSFVPQDEIIGREANKEAIMEQLLVHISEENELMVIAIDGAAGVGKTALAQLIFNDSRVQDYFDLSIWVCVTEVFKLKDIMRTIVASVTNKDQRRRSGDELARLFRQEILGKRYLLVLDDLWYQDQENWSDLRSSLHVGADGSRVIVTTHEKEVATITAGKEHTYQLKPLDEKNSWSLFMKVAFEKGQPPNNSNVIKIGKQIVAKCGGIPLAIRTIGGILYFKNAETEWQSFYEKELPKILNGKDKLASLKLSSDNLPYFLKPCLAYCGLFPKDYEIDVQTLVNLWMSLGFIKSTAMSDLNLEDLGYEYFVDLLRRSFFQETMRDERGHIAKCKMQNFMCDLARSVAPKVYATLGLKGGNNGTRIHHVSFDFHVDSSWHIRLLAQSKRIRSLILPRQLRQEVEGRSTESVCEEVTKFKYLRMLDLHNSGIKVVPDTIGDLTFLRYLDLSQNLNIKALPKSIGRLQNLQTLKLNHCSNLQMFPRAITKLVNLRNLENGSCYCLTHMPQRLSQLSNLRTLSEFVLSKDTSSVSNQNAKLDELAELNELRGKLKIKNLSCLAGDKATKAKLNQKQHLVSLALTWDVGTYVKEYGCELSLANLKPHPNLRELSICSYGGVRYPRWLSQHKNLVKFSLSKCRKCQWLPPLDCLPLLEVLLVDELPELEYISFKTSVDKSGAFFRSLRELRLTNLPKLVRWWKHAAGVEETTIFLRLSKLIIKDCPNLISMPLFPCLEELMVLKNTKWQPFQVTLEAHLIPRTTSEASSSTSPTVVTSLFPLSKLRTLCIINMPNGGLKMWKSLSSLRSLTVDHLQDVETLLEGLEQVTSLQELHIWRCDSLKEISWISNIRSLRILSLRLCPNLMMPRDRISLIASLQRVEIEECPRLSHIERMLEDRSYRQ